MLSNLQGPANCPGRYAWYLTVRQDTAAPGGDIYPLPSQTQACAPDMQMMFPVLSRMCQIADHFENNNNCQVKIGSCFTENVDSFFDFNAKVKTCQKS